MRTSTTGCSHSCRRNSKTKTVRIMKREYARAHRGMLDVARILAASSLLNLENEPSPENIKNVVCNAQFTLLANAAAGRYMMELAGMSRCQEQQEEILRISRPHVDSIPTRERERFLKPGIFQKECVAVVDTRGLIMHQCPGTGDQEQLFPCPGCPAVTARIPGITEYPEIPEQPAPRPRTQGADPALAGSDGMRILAVLDAIAEDLGTTKPPVTQQLAASLILMASAAYYAYAAIEWLTPANEGERHNETPQYLGMAGIQLKIYGLLGGTDTRPLNPQDDGTGYFCTRFRGIRSGKIDYICDPPSGKMDPGMEKKSGLRESICSECPYRTETPRAQPEELIPGELIPGELIPGELIPGELIPGELIPER